MKEDFRWNALVRLKLVWARVLRGPWGSNIENGFMTRGIETALAIKAVIMARTIP